MKLSSGIMSYGLAKLGDSCVNRRWNLAISPKNLCGSFGEDCSRRVLDSLRSSILVKFFLEDLSDQH